MFNINCGIIVIRFRSKLYFQEILASVMIFMDTQTKLNTLSAERFSFREISTIIKKIDSLVKRFKNYLN